MQVLRDQSACPRPPEGTAVTIGAYDGVHLGHRAVIEQVKQVAAADGLRTAVVTFDRHPASVVRPESAPKLLTDLDQKLELLAETEIDYVLVIAFDEARSKEPAEEFVSEVLIDCLAARGVIVGEDFHFGHQRRGNVALLREMGATAGFAVEGIDLVGVDGTAAPGDEQVSSTRIRRALQAGDLPTANRLLGRPHEVRGVVVKGDGRAAALLDCATANLNIPDEICLPADGIYAGWYVTPDGTRHASAISLGRRPTFYEDQPYSLLEAHLLDGDHDLYGQHGRVQFVDHLRDEERFESVEALKEQMAADCDEARARLG
jgi:riboflavin kinase/FMN adenylyltransferase